MAETLDLRELARWAVDFRRRMLVYTEPVPRCKGCGRDLREDDYTIGCVRCSNRRSNRGKRERACR